MKHKILIIILFIMTYESSLLAQNKYTFSQFFYETIDFVKQPTKWDGNDYLKIGLIFTATGLTMFADEPIQKAVFRDGEFYKNGDFIPENHKIGDFRQESQKYYYSVPIVAGRMYGELYSPVILFSAFATYSLIADDDWSRKVAYEIGQASLYGGGLTLILKTAIGRARPYMEVGNGTYRPFSSILIQDYHSLPGGHCTAATIISTVLSRNVEPTWLKVLCYLPVGLTVVSRTYQNQHWASDDVMGVAFGYFVAKWVVDKHEKGSKSENTDDKQSLLERIQLQPVMTGDYYGLNLSLLLF